MNQIVAQSPQNIGFEFDWRVIQAHWLACEFDEDGMTSQAEKTDKSNQKKGG